MDPTSHWDDIYRKKGAQQVSWYRAHLERSLSLLANAGARPSSRLIDVGGGASSLVDDLLDRGFGDVTVLDLSDVALEEARRRLGSRAASVTWLVGDVTTVQLPSGRYDVWHDRAVFHFLREPDARARYVAQLRHAVVPGGLVLIATFALDGPTQCSGLPVERYSAQTLHATLGEGFTLVESATEAHQTPSGGTQAFTFCLFQLR